MATPSSPVSPALPDQNTLVPVFPQSWGRWTVTLGYVFEAVLISIPVFMFLILIRFAISRFTEEPKDIKSSTPPDHSLDNKTAKVVVKSLYPEKQSLPIS